jgi:Domain of unknown function (DUF4276)
MRKIALFVEGQTELIVVREYLLRWFNYSNISIECRTLFTDGKFHTAPYDFPTPTPQYFFQIINVGNDNAVLSRILKREEYMWNAGYDKIIGLRDMYSKDYREITHRIDANVNNDFINAHEETINTRAKNPKNIAVCFAIMETEAWFLGLSHIFEQMDARLTHLFIQENTAHDLENNDPEKTVFHPAAVLNDIYNLIGQKYKKHEGDIEAILNLTDKTDFENLLNKDKCQSFNQFHEAIHN